MAVRMVFIVKNKIMSHKKHVFTSDVFLFHRYSAKCDTVTNISKLAMSDYHP